ncbi:MAG: glycosyltransferase family 2 protein [candidate division KSB1 bacterium]|nr:glycosyltransferase family 2 protein [candidate division KSB1 bacterium]
MKISIIIISYNTRDLLRACLQSVYRQTPEVDFEIIIVDNASTDGSREMLQQEFPQAKKIFNTTNKGFAAANNQALAQATGEYLLLLNSDTEVLPGAITQSLEFMEQHPEAGIVGCKLLNPDFTLQPSCESFPNFWDVVFESFFLDRLFPNNKLFGRFHLRFFRYDRIAKVDSVMGAFLLIRRATVEAIGMLDEGFFFYSEETDWCYRAKRKGWEVYFFPGAQAIHHCSQSADPVASKMFVQLHASRYRFYKKYHSTASSLAVRLVFALGAFLRIPLWTGMTFYRLLFEPGKAATGWKKVRAQCAALAWYLGLVKI